ncbi:MAG: threonine synthase [Nitrososphaerota archaeon]|nr:threonine synthase [Nitrososphaerota archaeon]MDG6940001.1 threonine synthase [Nitrososphaerota archaeon]
MSSAASLRCRECGKEYPLSLKYVCGDCFGPVDVVYDYDSMGLNRNSFVSRPKSLWRYHEFLPVELSPESTELQAGYTPLVNSRRLAGELGLGRLYVKNDTVNPTGSFKDRPAALGVARAVQFGLKSVGCASTGNLAAATSAYAARSGVPCFVFVPYDIEPAKVSQAQAYGANILAVEGTYDDANRLAAQAGELYGIGVVNINLRPYYVEGSKTLAFEVAEQLGWEVPDHVIIPVGSGAMLHAICKGFEELRRVGLTDRVPRRVTAVEPAGCAPIAHAFQKGSADVMPVEAPRTIAKSLAIGDPGDGAYVLKDIRKYGGEVEEVHDEQIVDAVYLLAKSEGIFAEPAGGVTIAALKKLVEDGRIDKDESVVCYVTGSGLKTPDLLEGSLPRPTRVKPDARSLSQVIAR